MKYPLTFLYKLFITIIWSLRDILMLAFTAVFNICLFLWHFNFKFEAYWPLNEDFYFFIKRNYYWPGAQEAKYYKNIKALWLNDLTIEPAYIDREEDKPKDKLD